MLCGSGLSAHDALQPACHRARRAGAGMTNPPYMLEHLAAIAEVLNHERVFAFLHIPVQVRRSALPCGWYQ